jgi:hypothetical protein
MNAVPAVELSRQCEEEAETQDDEKGGAVWAEAGIRPELWKGKREDEEKGWPVV